MAGCQYLEARSYQEPVGEMGKIDSESSVSTWSDSEPELLLGETVGALVRVLVRAGVSIEAISNEVARELAKHSDADNQVPPVRLGLMQRDCMEVMCRWRRDRVFLDSHGLPAELPRRGGDASFEKLCVASGVRCSPSELLDTLIEFGAVQLVGEDNVAPLTPTFLLGGGVNKLALDGVLKQVAAFLRVVDHNTGSGVSGALPRFERMCTVAIAVELLPVFERMVRERGQDFIDGLDEWLERHRETPSPSSSFVEVGAGAYFVELGNLKKE